MTYAILVTCPRHMEYLLTDELTALGLSVTKTTPNGVYGDASLEMIYTICVWSRLANRVQVILFDGDVTNVKSMYDLCALYPWRDVFAADKSFAIDFNGTSSFITNTMYGAQVIKDAVVDHFKQHDERPSVDRQHPNIRLHAHLKRQRLTVSLDCVGYSLHQRGYRERSVVAPLKENIAAGILTRLGWTDLAKAGYCLVDPCCGTGTFLIEGAMMAANIAPGLLRHDQSLCHWLAHDEGLWQSVRQQAKQQRCNPSIECVGFDHNADAIALAKEAVAHANLPIDIALKQQSVKDFSSLASPGLLVTNPPYGERLSDEKALMPLYQSLGVLLHTHCQGWRAGILTSNQQLANAIGLRKEKPYQFMNGPLATTLYCFEIDATNQLKTLAIQKSSHDTTPIANRLKKNFKQRTKWLKRTSTQCYRLYDADLPDYAFAIDVYGDWVHVQEYAAPKEIPAHKTQRRLDDILRLLPDILSIDAKRLVVKRRERQRGKEQYQRQSELSHTFQVEEGAARFKVNLHDYLDTGLFLDHRPLRLQFAHLGKVRVLNCFCYTGAFSVHAALGGATTCNVDLSNTYLNWAKDNFRINHLSLSQHRFVQADCLQWLSECQQTFDVILLDPPSFSNSKRMSSVLDVQADHVQLIEMAMHCLTPEGVLYFSNNLKKFRLDPVISQRFSVKDITTKTIDDDFKQSKHVHACYTLQHKRP